MKAIICAAGKGERLGFGIPKALVKVAGKPIINWQLDALKRYEVTVVAGYKAEDVIRQVGGRARVVVSASYETTSTCHSIALAGGDSACLIVDGDVLFTREKFPPHPFVGICRPRSENPVYAKVEDGLVMGFGLSPEAWEWACIFSWRPSFFVGRRTGYVYEAIRSKLPAPAEVIDCFEVDTVEDLRGAEEWAAKRT